MNLLKSKKGGLGKSIIAAVVFMFSFGFLSILGYHFTGSFIEQFDNTTYTSAETDYVGSQMLWGITLLDWVIVILLVVFIIGVAVANWKLASPPVFFFVQFVMGIFYGAVSYFFNYLFQELAGVATLDTARLAFPNTLLICTNLHWIALVMLIVGSIALFGKGQSDKGQFVE